MNFSIIVPFYNEQNNISLFHKEIIRAKDKIEKKKKFYFYVGMELRT